MPTAIIDFAKTSSAHGDEPLRDLTPGERRVALEWESRMIVAAVFHGRDPQDVRSEMRAFVIRAETTYRPKLAKWSGDPTEMHGLEVMAGRLFL